MFTFISDYFSCVKTGFPGFESRGLKLYPSKSKACKSSGLAILFSKIKRVINPRALLAKNEIILYCPFLKSLNSAKQIVRENEQLKGKIDLRPQANPKHIFKGVIKERELFDLTICNPPFHSSLDHAEKANQRKWKNLSHENKGFNFSGQKAELWCEDGEIAFLTTMISESVDYQEQVGWFASLVSKKENLPKLKSQLTRFANSEVKVMPLTHGQKVMHVLCWRFNNSPT